MKSATGRWGMVSMLGLLGWALLPLGLDAQSYNISRLAGSPTGGGYLDGLGTGAQFNRPIGTAVDSAGNVYVTDSANGVIRKISPAGVTTTFVGAPGEFGAADGTGSAARFGFIQGIAADGQGNLYVADSGYNTIRRVTPDGTVTTLAGSAGQGGSVDGVGTAALFDFPCAVAVDASGNVYVGDAGYDQFFNPVNNKIRKIAPDGTVTTLAGSPQGGSADGTGSAAQFNFEESGALVVDGAGNVYVADSGNNTLRVVTPDGVVTTLAGSPGVYGTSDGTGSQAQFAFPDGIALDSAGNLYVADGGSNVIRKVTSDGVVTTVAGQVNVSGLLDGTGVAAAFAGPLLLTSDGTNLLIPDITNNALRQMVIPTAEVTTLAGGNAILSGAVDGVGVAARFSQPSGLATDGTDLYVADASNDTIRAINLVSSQVITLAGTAGVGGAVDGVGTSAQFLSPRALATDGMNLYVADAGNSTIRQINLASGQVTTLAGAAGIHGSADGVGTAALFSGPKAVTSNGNYLYVADTKNSTIRQVDLATSQVTTLAGTAGVTGSADGAGGTALFNFPDGLATDGSILYVADNLNYTIRRIVIATGQVTTLAGSAGVSGSSDGIGTAASFTGPSGIAIDGTTLYVGDGPTLRTIDLQTGLVTTRVGTPGWIGGMDGTGAGPRLWAPNGITVANGTVYIADSAGDVIFQSVGASTAGPATHFDVTAPANSTTGLPFTVTITARDASNNVATSYMGTSHFTSSDRSAILPGDYTFVAGDAGSRSFLYALRLNTVGTQTIVATDGSISGTASVAVRAAVVTTWQGTVSDHWSDSGNWSEGTPGEGDTAIFPPGAQHLSMTNDLADGMVLGALVFSGNSRGYTISGNSIGLSGGIPQGGSDTLSVNLQLVANQTFDSSRGELVLNGAIDLQSYTLTMTCCGVVNGVVSGSGGLSVQNAFFTNPGNSYIGPTSGVVDLVGGNVSDISPGTTVVGSGTVGNVSGGNLQPSQISNPITGNPFTNAFINTGNVSLGSTNIEYFAINGPTPGIDYSQLRVTGTVSLGGANLNLTLSNSFVPSLGQSFVLISNDGSDPVVGTFNGLPEGSTITLNGFYQFTISYVGGDGNDVTLTSNAIPKTWTGASSDLWSDPGNWAGGIPVAGDVLLFPPGAQHLSMTNDLADGMVLGALVFSGNSRGYTISGNSIGLSGGIPQGGSDTLSVNLQLVANQTFDSSRGELVLNGAIDLQSYTLTMTCCGVVNGVVSGSGGLSVQNAFFTNPGNSYIGPTSGVVDLVGGNVSDISPGTTVVGSGTVGNVSGGNLQPSQISNPITGNPFTNAFINTGNVSLGSTNIEYFAINGPTPGIDYSQLRVTGTVSLGGANLNLTLSNSFVPSLGQSFVLISNDGSDPVVGTFNGLPEGSTITLNGFYQFTISYVGGDGNDVTLTSNAIPKTWTGASSDLWSDPGNWAGGIPVAGDVLLFPPGAQHLSMTNDLADGMVLGALVFSGNSRGYTISGNSIGLSGGIPQGGSDTLSVNLQLVANQTFDSSRGELVLNGAIDLQSYTLTMTCCGVVNGVVSGSGGLSVQNAFFTNPGNSYIGPTSGVVDLVGGNVSDISPGTTVVGSGTVGNVSGGNLQPSQISNPITGNPFTNAFINTGNVSLGSTNIEYFAINGPTPGIDYSQLRVTGTVSLGGANLNLTLSNSFVPSLGQSFVLISNDGSDPVVGTFNGLPEGSTITLNGFYQFTISYVGGDGNDVTLTSNSGSLPVNVTLVTSPNPAALGQSVMFSATVTASGGPPTGSVSFRDSGTAICSGVLTGGLASCATSSLLAGGHTIFAIYLGDGTFGSGASNPVVQQVNQPATAVVSGGGSFCAGGSATVLAALTGTAPWSVTWSDGLVQSAVAMSPLSRSAAPTSTTTYAITAVSDANGPGTSSGSAMVIVNAPPTVSIFPAGPITLLDGQSVTLDARATSPTGATLLFSWSTGDITSTISVSNPGSYFVTVTDGNGCITTSLPVVVTVSAMAADVQVTLASSASSAAIDQDVTLTITATNAGPSDASGVVVTDVLPSSLSLVSATPSTGIYNSTNGVWSIGALPNGALATLTIVATVTQTGSIADTASKTSQNEPDPDPANDSATVVISGQPTADVRVTKMVDNPAPLVGQNATFTVTASNAGPSDGSGIQVTDLLPSGLQFVSANPSSATTYDSSTGFWTVGALPNGTSATLQVVAMISQPGAITNNATKTAQFEFDPNTSNDSAAASLNAQPVADIQIQNGVSNPSPDLGQNVVLTVTATNAGPNDATGIQVTDLLPAGLAYISALPPGLTTYNSATGVWNIGALGNGASLSMQITAKVNATGPIVDTASKTAQVEDDPNPANDSASLTLNGQPSADVQLAQSASSPTVSVGQSVQFNITSTNLGPSSATGLQVTDSLPGSLSFVSAMPSQGTYDSGTGLWDMGSLAPSVSATLQIVAVVGQTGSITNTATKTSENEPDPNAGNDSAAVTITGQSSADIGMTMTSNKPNPAVGTNVTFTVKASNGGPDNASGVQVTDLLPAGLSFVSATPTQGSYTSGTGVWNVGAVNNGVTTTLTLVAKVAAAGTILNTATKTAENETDLNPVNDSASVTLNKEVTTTTLVSSVNPSTFGQSVSFTATVSSGSGTPTGTVTFKRGATVLGPIPLSGGVATFMTSTLPVGTGSITAAYGGDTNSAPSTSTAVRQKVIKATTTTALVANPSSSSTYGQSVTLTATVTSAGGTPAGTVTFKSGGALGTATLVNGVASLTTTALPGGARSITAVYGGDPDFATSTSAVLSFTVNPSTTSTALTTSQNPSVYKQPITFTATVTSPGLTPTGNVKFMNGAATLGTVALSSGSASLTTTALTVGSHSITAVYVVTANFATSTSAAIAQVVNPASTVTVLTTTPNPSIAGQQVTLTATVSSAYATPTGSVTFKNGAATIGTKTLSSGVATLNTTTLSSGTHAITAVYAGTANFVTSTSPPASQVVN